MLHADNTCDTIFFEGWPSLWCHKGKFSTNDLHVELNTLGDTLDLQFELRLEL